MNKKRILAIIGSTKSNSSNLAIIKTLQALSENTADIVIYDGISTLPYFNPDLDNETPPTSVVQMRTQIELADAVIITTPEYVFSLPGILKNALEWAVSTRVFANKPVALITAAASGEKAHESLLLILKTIEAKFDHDSCLLIQGVKGKVDKDGNLNTDTIAKLNKVLQSLMLQMETT